MPRAKSQAIVKDSPDAIRREQMANEAIKLRVQGWTYDEIAEHVGFESTSKASNAVRARLLDIRRDSKEDLHDLQHIERERLDMLWRKVSKKIEDGNTESGVINAALKVCERKAKLLGLDKPTKHEHEIQFGMSRLEADNSSDHKVAVLLLQKCAVLLGENPIDIAREAILALGDAAPPGLLQDEDRIVVKDAELIDDVGSPHSSIQTGRQAADSTDLVQDATPSGAEVDVRPASW